MCVTYGVLRVIFVISLMCLFAFVFVVFILISTNKVCEFSLSFCTVVFYIAPCKILLHMGALQKMGVKTQCVVQLTCVNFFHSFDFNILTS